MESLFKLFYQTSGVCTDSRKILKDSFFICLKGENFDGNEFAKQAIENGAKYVISENSKYCDEKQIFYVNNSLKFLQELANYHRKQFNIPIIGITGSNGKTTSKELISTVLSKKYNVLFTLGNLNNHIGVPLTLLNLKAEHEIAVIEMGANKGGDIKELCDIAEPNFGIITNIGKAHLEGFINFEGVLKTKKELYDSVEETNGVLFFNADDEVLCKNIPNSIKTYSFSENKDSLVNGELLSLTPYVELKWSSLSYQSEKIKTHLVGKYNFYNFLAAITIGAYFEVGPDQICKALEEYIPTNNRSQIENTEYNTLIMDCYNANPTSVMSALESFVQIDSINKYFVLGDMLELGNDSNVEHQKIIDFVVLNNLQGVFVGELYKNLEKDNDFKFYKNREEFINELNRDLIKNKLILIKGSRGIGLEILKNYL